MSELRQLGAHRPLEGRLVRLRALELADERQLYRFFNDEDVTGSTDMRYPVSHHAQAQFVEQASEVAYNKVRNLAVERLDDGSLIGVCGFHRPSPENRGAWLGITIGEKSCWDRGYGTDAVRVLCRFGFQQMNLHRIDLGTLATNKRARHVYEKVGFRHEVTRRDAIFKYGRYIDVHHMGLIEGELIDE